MRDVSGIEVPINKKVKTDSHGTDAASSSLDNSCFVAFVTDSSLDTDTLVFTLLLHLPKSHTNSLCMLSLVLHIRCSLIPFGNKFVQVMSWLNRNFFLVLSDTKCLRYFNFKLDLIHGHLL